MSIVNREPFRAMECFYGTFSHNISLPKNVDSWHVGAEAGATF